MLNYICRRLLLLPLTLFCIVLVNFVIINLAPGDPATVTEISPEGMATRSENKAVAFGSDDRYLQFREHYGLTLPILINFWPFISEESVKKTLWQLTYRKYALADTEEINAKNYNALRVRFGDQSKYIMRQLLDVIQNESYAEKERLMAVRFFIRGGVRQAYLGVNLSPFQKEYNRKIAEDNSFLYQFLGAKSPLNKTSEEFGKWYGKNKAFYHFEPSFWGKFRMMGETRLFRYLSRVFTLDFGTLRNDSTKRVIDEVSKRFKYSLTLALLPMIVTFFLSQLLGMVMAYTQNKWQDTFLNVMLLIFYALPVFVVAPFLIEKVALNHDFFFTKIPIPISGFTSPEAIYATLNSRERLFDVIQHILLPLLAIMYGTLAASARLSRTAILEVYAQDYVRTARAKGLSRPVVMVKHVGRNAAITLVTSLASSLGVILGGSLIVETLFQINGFGKFFYDAVINRDYNVIMFSALSGAFLTLMGYLARDIAYTMLDPRVTLE